MLRLKNYFSKTFNGLNLSQVRKYFNESRNKYTESLDINQILTVTPARKVPDYISRPIYVYIKNLIQK